MTSPFPFEAFAKPGKDAFDFWISFFPTAPLFGVEWRFAEMAGPMADPTMNPFLQAGQSAFVMPFPGTTPAGVAARPGELASPAAADERQGRPVAKAAGAAADAATQATRVAAETGKAAARTVEATVKAGGTAAETAQKRAGNAAAAELKAETPKQASATAGKPAEAAAKASETVSKAAKPGNGAAPAGETDKRAAATAGKPADKTAGEAGKKAEARATAPETAQATKGQPEAAVADGPRPKGLLSKRPDDADDLKMLKGVGPGLEKQLNELGLWKLEQLTKMSDADLEWIDANLTSFKGRCFRDDWVGQAKSRLKK